MPLWGGLSVEIVDEDASFASSSTSSSRAYISSSSRISVGTSSTYSRDNNGVVTPRDVAQQQQQHQQQQQQRSDHQLRRRSTFHRLSRWVSRRASRQWTVSVPENPAHENNGRTVVPNSTKEGTVLAASNVLREERDDADLPSSPKTVAGPYAPFRDRVFSAAVTVTEQQQGRGSSSSENPSLPSPSNEPIRLVTHDRLFIRSPPQSILNLRPEQRHSPQRLHHHPHQEQQHRPSWRRIATAPEPILEIQSSFRLPSATTIQPKPAPLTAPEDYPPRAAAAATLPKGSFKSNISKNNLSFADRIRAVTQVAAASGSSSGPRPGLPVLSSPCATAAPPLQVGNANVQPQPSSSSPLRRRQSVWQPLKSKLSLLRLRE